MSIDCENKNSYSNCFAELILKAYAKYNCPVVVLIDEYDKPILDAIENLENAYENREILKDFYSVLKDLDPYLKLVFLTGVSRFSKVPRKYLSEGKEVYLIGIEFPQKERNIVNFEQGRVV